MPITNYDKGFPNGVSIRQVPILDLQNNNGYTLWVDSTTGQDSNDGTFTYPLKTLAKAVEILSSSSNPNVSSSFYRCNKVIIAAGHTETISTIIDFTNVGNTQIFGMGCGKSRPAFSFTGTDVNIGLKNFGNGCYIGNCSFITSINNLVSVIDIVSSAVIENCNFIRQQNSSVSIISLSSLNGIDDYVGIINCKFNMIGGLESQAIYLNSAISGVSKVEINGCYIVGNFTNAPIYNPISNIIANLVISNNICQNTATGRYAIQIVSACNGTCSDNYMYTDSYSTMLDSGSLKCFNNVGVNAIDIHGVVMPVA